MAVLSPRPPGFYRATMTSHFVPAGRGSRSLTRSLACCLSAITALRYTAKISDSVWLRDGRSVALSWHRVAGDNIHISNTDAILIFPCRPPACHQPDIATQDRTAKAE